MYSAKIIDLFWRKVARCPHGDTCALCCWEWQGGRTRGGYGKFSYSVRSEEGGKASHRQMRANRMCWAIMHGDIPLGLHVLHDCPRGDNPACVNPQHLWVGTREENMADCVRKGRAHRGERDGMAKLTTEQVKEIRHLYQQGMRRRALAEKFQVHQGTIWEIIRNRRWQHLVDECPITYRKDVIGEKNHSAKLSTQDVRRIREYAVQGLSQRHIAKMFNIHPSTARTIILRLTWKHVDPLDAPTTVQP